MTFKIIILQGEGMKIDLTQAMKDCEGIQKIEQRSDTGKVRNIYKKIIFIYREKNSILVHIGKTKKKKKRNNNTIKTENIKLKKIINILSK